MRAMWRRNLRRFFEFDTLSCPELTFLGPLGQSQCVLCPAGSWGNSTGLTSCQSCPPATHSALLSGSLGCVPCEVWTFMRCCTHSHSCAAERHICASVGFRILSRVRTRRDFSQPRSGRVHSMPARSTNFFAVYFATTLSGVGTFAPAVQQSLCYDCEVGRFSAQSGSFECLACSAVRNASDWG